MEEEGGWVLVVAIGMVCCGFLGFSCGDWDGGLQVVRFWVLVVAAMMVACGGWDGGLWVAGIWLWQLGWSVVVVYSGFLGFMKACSGSGD